MNSKRLSISPISPFRPRRWKGKIVSDKSKINIKNLNSKKRPISAVADNIEVRNAFLTSILSATAEMGLFLEFKFLIFILDLSLTILPFHLLGLNGLIGDIDNLFEFKLNIGP